MNQVYQIVTDRIVGMLESGVVPWERPWITTSNAPRGYDMAPGETYRGINRLLLPPGEYLTEKAVEKKGGRILNKRDYYIATFFKMTERRTEEGVENETIEEQLRPCFRFYKVFHLSNIEGVPSKNAGRDENSIGICPSAESLIGSFTQRYGIQVAHMACDAPFYQVESGTLTLPYKRQFVNDESYYSVVFHELLMIVQQKNATLRPQREGVSFYDPEFTCQKLVAEMGSAFLMSHCGLDNSKVLRNSAARIQGWINTLKAHPCLCVTAARQADKLADALIDSVNNDNGDSGVFAA